MSSLPKDPIMLLSYINLKLRDYYPSFEEFCEKEDADKDAIISTLESIDYHYDEKLNKFI